MRPQVLAFPVSLAIVTLATVAGVAAVRHGTARMREAAQVRDEHRQREIAARDAAPDAARHDAMERVAESAARQREAEALVREIDTLRARLEAPRPGANLTRSSLLPTPNAGSVWKNQGRAQPAAAFETVQWAIEAGEVGELRAAIALDGAAREAAASLFASLDSESQAEFGTPEHLVAAVMAAKSRSDLTGAQVLEQTQGADGVCSLRLHIAGTHMAPREITLRFQPSPDGWRLSVPAKIITSYRHLLFGPVVDPKTYQVLR